MPIRRVGNRWQVRVTVGGKRLEQTVPPTGTRADAKALEAALLRRSVEYATGQQPQRLIDEAFQEWEPIARGLKSWEKDIRYRLEVLKKYTVGKTLKDIPEVARKFTLAGKKAELSPAGINRYLAILKRVANLAEKWGWIDAPISSRIEMVPGEQPRHVYLTMDQIRALAKAAGGEEGDAILMLALTGLRRSELLRLTPDSIRGGVILLDARTKNGKPRAVPMPADAARIAVKRLPWKITATDLRYAWERARTAVGLPGIRLHDARHSYASWMIQEGVSVTSVRDLLGHSSTAVTSRYSHLTPEHLQDAVSRLDRAYSGKTRKRKVSGS